MEVVAEAWATPVSTRHVERVDAPSQLQSEAALVSDLATPATKAVVVSPLTTSQHLSPVPVSPDKLVHSAQSLAEVNVDTSVLPAARASAPRVSASPDASPSANLATTAPPVRITIGRVIIEWDDDIPAPERPILPRPRHLRHGGSTT